MGGRPTMGTGHVEKLNISADAKERLRVIMMVDAGEMAIAEACQRLGIRETRFHMMREQALQAAGERLEKRKSGPKPELKNRETPEGRRIRELEEEVLQLKIELNAARVKTQIALTMPHVLANEMEEEDEAEAEEAQKKTKKEKEKRRRKEKKGGLLRKYKEKKWTRRKPKIH